jgi:hypothetical protein
MAYKFSFRLRQKDAKEHTAISLEAEHKEGKVRPQCVLMLYFS